MNLVVNARDAMPSGGRLTIETSQVELDNFSFHSETVMRGSFVMLAITDTGEGMSPEVQRKLFEPFFTTKGAGRGTGLGLSTTYGIVKQSKGYIWVYSEVGCGTTFKVYLPCSETGAKVSLAPGPVAVIGDESGETVLLVEDQDGVRQLARRILAQAGFRVLEAADGAAAEKIFAANPDAVDIVLTDVIMPGFDGLELVRRLRVTAPALRAVFMSGYTERGAAQKAGIAADLAFLQKPFTAAKLIRCIRDGLDKAAAV
jgi:Signal transduction histidine kinase